MPRPHTPRGYPAMSGQEKAARLAAGAEFFDACGVAVTEKRLRAFLNATCWIPWEHQGRLWFREALSKAIREKGDGYQTAPQPGVVWEAFYALVPASMRDYSPATGSVLPQWASGAGRAQAELQLPAQAS